MKTSTPILALVVLASLALSACSTQMARYNKITGDYTVVNNNFLNKKKNERFVYEFDPKTGKIRMNVSSQGMNNASVAETGMMAWGAANVAAETTTQFLAKEKTTQNAATQATIQNGQNTAPTVYNAAEGFKVDRAMRVAPP